MGGLRQRGFAAVEGIIVLVIVLALAGVGYFVYNNMQNNKATTTADEQTQSKDTPAAPAVDDTGDLNKASKALDDTNVDASTTDSNSLDTETKAF